jgi:ornithine decarboxylase
LDLVGISFHVGSGQMSPQAFGESIENARQLFDYAREQYGCRMHLLDLGGGYPGSSDSGELFSAIAAEINRALAQHFPEDLFRQINAGAEHQLKVIAEPGRYYACSAFTLCTGVIAKRVMKTVEQDKSIMYYINDGVYASFNCLFYDHAEVDPILLSEEKKRATEPTYKTSIWGPTCDGLDLIVKECRLPELKIGDFMAWKDMGAYTLSGAVAFNGIPLAKCIYVASQSWSTIKNAFDQEMEEPVTPTNVSAAAVNTCAVAASMSLNNSVVSKFNNLCL